MDLVRRGFRWKVGEGDRLRMWMDPWLKDDSMFYVGTPTVPGFEDMDVRDFYVPDTRTWDVEVISEVFSEVDIARITHTTPAPAGVPDMLIWHFAPNGIYSVKSVYHLGMSLVSSNMNSDGLKWPVLWKKRVPPRIKAFHWRLCKGWLAVQAQLCRWYPGMSSICPVCESSGLGESLWHLFVDCNFVVSCWKTGGLWSKINKLCYEVGDQGELFLRVLLEFEGDEAERGMTIVWVIWCHINQVVRLATTRSLASCLLWHPPKAPFVKISVDSAFFTDSMRTGIGLVLRDSTGCCIVVRTLHRQGLLDVMEGKALRVSEAFLWAAQMGINDVVVETDFQSVCDVVYSLMADVILFSDFISAGRRILLNHTRYSVVWVTRKANVVAHNLAWMFRSFENPYCWVEPPITVDGLLDMCT